MNPRKAFAATPALLLKVTPSWRQILVLLTSFSAVATPLRAEVLYWPLNAVDLARQRADTLSCTEHMRQLLSAASAWSLDNMDQRPPGLSVLADSLESPAVVYCPANCRSFIPTNWSDVDWTKVDYQWAATNWSDPGDVACRCNVHTMVGLVEGSVSAGGYRSGWPCITAAPLDVYATPGEEVSFQVQIAPDSLLPVSYQWRREELSYATNVVRVLNPDDPNAQSWTTNVVPVFTAVNLEGKTHTALTLHGVTTNDSGFYSVAIGNSLGVTACRPTRLWVDPSVAGIGTNSEVSEAYCVSNLRQISLFMQFWSLEHQHWLPLDFESMLNSFGSPIFGWPVVLFCLSDTSHSPPADWDGFDFSETSYEMPPGNRLNHYDVLCRCRVHSFSLQMDGEVIWRPRLEAIQRLPDLSGYQLKLRILPGKVNVLEASEDLANWSVLEKYGPDPADYEYIDFEALPQRFYRIRLSD
jgi:hypothetical protein